MVDWIFLLLTVAYSGLLCAMEIPALIKQKQYRELGTFIVLLGTGMLLGIVKFSGGTPPNPSDGLMWLFSPLKGFMQTLLK